MDQILQDVTTDIASYKNSSADWKILDLRLVQLTFKKWLTPNLSESPFFLSMLQALPGDQLR